jgi:DNA/RNA endonuclease YhcR with UshA esterase domain
MKKIVNLALCAVLAVPALCQTKINVEDVGKHIGENVIVCSKVYGTKYLDKSGITFINVGAAYPSSPLTVVIFGKDRTNFTKVPEELYLDKQICITGKIQEYKGKNEIIITRPDEITIE